MKQKKLTPLQRANEKAAARSLELTLELRAREREIAELRVRLDTEATHRADCFMQEQKRLTEMVRSLRTDFWTPSEFRVGTMCYPAGNFELCMETVTPGISLWQHERALDGTERMRELPGVNRPTRASIANGRLLALVTDELLQRLNLLGPAPRTQPERTFVLSDLENLLQRAGAQQGTKDNGSEGGEPR